jgi:peptidoglycan-N-acetylglucosamine deacetylase
MLKRSPTFIVRVLLWLLLLLLCLFWNNIHKGLTIYAQSSISSQELFNELKQGHRIIPAQIEPIKYTTPQQPTIYLTFDDGPSAQTPKVLDILHNEGITASFFVLGQMAEQHPDLIKRIVKEGHTLGNHTYNHVYKQLYQDITEFWRQIQKTEKILYDITGLKPELVRAPGGTSTHFSAFYYYDMDQAGYTVIDWNMDSADSTRANITAKEIVEKVKQSGLKHEVILLMHDGAGHGQTVQALPEIIHYFKEKGYAFAPLTPLVKPVQFPIVKTKWASAYSYDQFANQENIIMQYAVARKKEIADANQKVEEQRLLLSKWTNKYQIILKNIESSQRPILSTKIH